VFVPAHDAVVSKRHGTVIVEYEDKLGPDALGVREFGLHEHTVHQEVLTLANRHLFLTPQVDESSPEWAAFNAALLSLSDEFKLSGKVSPCSSTDVIRPKKGRARKRARVGFHHYYTKGVGKREAVLTEMQKLEMYEVDKISGKEDRGIQFRHVGMNAAYSRYIVPIEHRLVTLYGGNSVLPFMAKGLTLEERGLAICQMADRFNKPAFILMDHSRFDAHLGVELLKAVHRFYARVVGRGRKELMRLLKFQLAGRGYSAGGVHYRHRGGRCSGDQDTGCGNSVDNYANIRSWLDLSGVSGEILLDGDDSVVIIEESDLEKLVDCKNHMLKLGMETEYEVVGDISQVEFCQAKVGLTQHSVSLIPNPLKFLGKSRVLAQNCGIDQGVQILRSTIEGVLATLPDLPMYRPFWRWYVDNPGKVRLTPEQVAKNERYGVKSAEFRDWIEPSEETRLSFAKSWGISPSDQVLFEKSILKTAGELRRKEPRVRDRELVVDDVLDWLDTEGIMGSDSIKPTRWSEQSEAYRSKWVALLTSSS